MTKNEWFDSFESALDGLYADEKSRAREYYEELFADKLEQGADEEDILKEFGAPETAAKKIKDAASSDVGTGVDADEDTAVTVIDDTKAGEGEKTSACQTKKAEKPLSAFGKAFAAIVPLVALMLFFIDGAVFHRWATAWLFFLLTPVAITLEVAIERKNAAKFAYPVFVLVVFFMFGFYFMLWHPMWILFMTIPLYYVIVKTIRDARGETDDCDDCGNCGCGDGAAVKNSTGSGASGNAHTAVVGSGSDGGDKPKRKKKWWVGLIIAAAITTAVVLSCFATISAINGLAKAMKPTSYNLTRIDTNDYYEVAETEVTKINVDTDVCAVFIEPTDEQKLSVNYVKSGFDKATLTTTVDGGVVNVKVESEWICKVFFPLSGVNAADRFLVIKVPASMTGTPDYVVKTTTGDVKISAKSGENTLSFKDVTIECVTGKVNIEDVTANDVKVKNTTGDTEFKNITASTLSLKMTTGDVKLSGVTLTGELTAGIVTGEINIEAVCKKATITSTTGKVDFTLTADDITVKSTTGDVSGVVKGVREEYTITTKVTTGKNRLGEQDGTTDKKLTVSVTTGDVDVKFE